MFAAAKCYILGNDQPVRAGYPSRIGITGSRQRHSFCTGFNCDPTNDAACIHVAVICASYDRHTGAVFAAADRPCSILSLVTTDTANDTASSTLSGHVRSVYTPADSKGRTVSPCNNTTSTIGCSRLRRHCAIVLTIQHLCSDLNQVDNTARSVAGGLYGAVVLTILNGRFTAALGNDNDTRCLPSAGNHRPVDAIFHRTAVHSRHDTSHIRAGNSTVYRQVLDSRALNRAEETGVATESGIETTIDAIDDHRLAVAVKGAGKLVVAALLSDGRPVRHSDARAQLKISVAIHCTAVHVRGQLIQPRLSRDHIRVSLRTGACPDSLRRPCACAQTQRHHQRQNGCQQFLHVSNLICFRFPQDASF